MKLIPLSKRGKNKGQYFAKVSDHRFDFLNQFNWSVTRHKNIRYAERRVSGKIVRMHRFIMGVTDPKVKVDHEDHDGLNCQDDNIRICSQTQNMQNGSKRENTTSIYKGVCYDKERDMWMAYIEVDKKRINLGRFDNERQAAIAYNNAAIVYYKDFANCNAIY